MTKTNKFVTYKEICDIVNNLDDYRDKVLIMLIFDGFYTQMDNIQNLKEEDIKEERYRYFGYRLLGERPISEETLYFIRKGLEEKEIHTFSNFKNGIDELIPSKYILRERLGYLNRCDIEVGERFNGFAMNKQSIINRFCKIKREYGLHFSLSSLYGSGVIHRGIEKIGNETANHRVRFLNYLQKKEGVSKGMGYLYYRHYLEMLPRLQAEQKGE